MARPRRGVINLVDYLIDVYGTFSVGKLFEALVGGRPDQEIAEGFGVTARTVCRWRSQLGLTCFVPRAEVCARLADYGVDMPRRAEEREAHTTG